MAGGECGILLVRIAGFRVGSRGWGGVGETWQVRGGRGGATHLVHSLKHADERGWGGGGDTRLGERRGGVGGQPGEDRRGASEVRSDGA